MFDSKQYNLSKEQAKLLDSYINLIILPESVYIKRDYLGGAKSSAIFEYTTSFEILTTTAVKDHPLNKIKNGYKELQKKIK